MVIDLDLPLRCQCKNDMPFDVGDCVQIWDFFHSALTHYSYFSSVLQKWIHVLSSRKLKLVFTLVCACTGEN